jgi:MFS family permease
MKLFDTFKKSPLILLAALVQSLAFALAGSVYFGSFGWVMGGLAGVVVNLSMAYASSRISEIAKARRALAWAAFGVLFILSPLAVAPAEYHLLDGKFPVWVCVVLALVWSILPDAAIIAAGGVAGKSLVVAEQPAQVDNQVAQPSAQRKKVARKVARNSIDRAQLAAELQRNPQATSAQLAQMFGVSRQAISKARRDLLADSLFASRGNA